MLSLAVGGMCVTLAVALMFIERLPGLRKMTHKLHTDRVQALLWMAAAIGVAGTAAGRWWQHAITTVNEWTGHLVGTWTGVAVTGLVGLIAFLMFVNDLITRKVEMRTRVLGAALPVLVTTVPGVLGMAMTTVVHGVASGMGQAVTWML
jgi:hypothetical protein